MCIRDRSPTLYGAFPTDPYSHTPGGKGAQQPGMTGQVKEDFLSRFGELGVRVKEGQLYFMPVMLRKEEFLIKEQSFNYVDIYAKHHRLSLPINALGFTYCQVPVVYHIADVDRLEIINQDNTITTSDSLMLDAKTSRKVFGRTGEVTMIKVFIKGDILK